jgi:hypothetical protein
MPSYPRRMCQIPLHVADHSRLRRLCSERREPAAQVIGAALRLLDERPRFEPSEAERLVNEFFRQWRGLPPTVY